jgi:hypothetical protein
MKPAIDALNVEKQLKHRGKLKDINFTVEELEAEQK